MPVDPMISMPLVALSFALSLSLALANVLQVGLCIGQWDFWHAVPQYLMVRQAPQIFSGNTLLPQQPQVANSWKVVVM